MQDDVKKPPQAPASQPPSEPVAPPPQHEAVPPPAPAQTTPLATKPESQPAAPQIPKHAEEHHLIPIIFAIVILGFLIVVAVLADKTKIGQ
jgi:hypothetical protein